MFVPLVLCILCLCVSSSYGVDYKEAYFDQKIDHFNFESYGSKTYKQRYLYNDTWWQPGEGPIFFYAGNEDAIDVFWENSGFITEIAPAFNALVVFTEHRFYGKSLPFGNASFEAPNIGVLSISQALADYAFFLKAFKRDFKAEKCPVVAFGGSYGGMLAAYMRFKYPNLVQGAIAASAPIYMVTIQNSSDLFFQVVTKDFRGVSIDCENQVRTAFAQLDKWASAGQKGLDLISKTLRLCVPLTSGADYDHLLRWARNAFGLAAMVDYPYPTSFIGNFPAFPVNVMCERLAAGDSPASGLRHAVDLYYNASGNLKCFDLYQDYIYGADPTGCSGTGPNCIAMDYQACTELNCEGGTDGVKDMFPVLPYSASMNDVYCQKTWGVTPRRDWMDVLLWGKDISSSSNIVFSNGDLDPWAAGGVLNNISDSIVSVIVKGGAHHLDLRGSNPADPASVVQARNFEVRNIQKWIREFYNY